MQVPVPEQPPPLQPVKVELASGVAVKVTAVALSNGAAHMAPQAMPAGELVMVPVPVPDLLTVSVKDCCAKVAVTEVEPAAGVAVRVTAVPMVNEAEQVAPHEMPEGALVTVPLPVPVLVTLRAK